MPDKKVSKSGAARPLSPSQRLDASLSDTGTVNMAEPTHAKAKSTLVDKFQEREERWRREQALHEQSLQGQQGETGERPKGEPEAAEQEDVIEEAVRLVEESEPLEGAGGQGAAPSESQGRSEGGVS